MTSASFALVTLFYLKWNPTIRNPTNKIDYYLPQTFLNMKFTKLTFATLTSLLISPSLACLHARGSITVSPLPGLSGIWAEVYDNDNNNPVCTGPSYIDQDSHYSLTCRPGYYWAISKNAAQAWYGYPGSSFTWTVARTSDTYDCYGACDDKKGACLSCTDYNWDQWLYC